MEKMGLNEIRELFLKFFENKDHLRLASFSLIPNNDKSLLLINAGMAPLKPFFTGQKIPPRKRVTTCQKCIRTGDIENVGNTSRHATFFEMLGNFSFGDYFKKEIIPWAWEFSTEILKLPKDKLYVTIFEDDDEAFNIWATCTDIDPARIFRLGKEENFWEHGQGPCGPCSEIHFDKGEGTIKTVEEFIKAGDEDRVLEFWNLVFTQFDKDENGNYNKLSNPNIDTGMGLERIATIMQGVDNIFEVDTMKSILTKISSISGVEYGKNKESDKSIRIISDHIRSITFMISDGILPSNEGRGYVLRRLLRRAARHGKKLGITTVFLCDVTDVVIDNFSLCYPELKQKKEYIKKIIKLDEEKFDETIDSGLQILNEYISVMDIKKEVTLSGSLAFKLYDTFGFPLELTEEILEEKHMGVDKDGFNQEMQLQRNRARAARAESNFMGTEDTILDKIPLELITLFDGYNKDELSSNINFMIKDEEYAEVLESGDTGVILTEITPFYSEMGGQVGDRGLIIGENFKAQVIDCRKNISGKIIHAVKVTEGIAKTGDIVTLKVDEERKNNIRRNHTATHMLNAALREVLGQQVHQSGSFVDDERLRFDFNHFEAVKPEELKEIEIIVNKNVIKVENVDTKVMQLEEAKKSGAVAIFDDKYKGEIRVVSVGDFSKEFCGGTHVKNSGEIGLFKIISECGVASGVRRIEAVTAIKALDYVEEKIELLKQAATPLKCSDKELPDKIQSQIIEIKEKEKIIEELKIKMAGSSLESFLSNCVEIKGVKLVTGVLDEVDGAALRELADKLRDKVGDGCIIVLGSSCQGKAQFIVMAGKDAINKGAHSGKIVKQIAQIAGGSGGGRPDMAQAGGKDIAKIQEAINTAATIVENMVK